MKKLILLSALVSVIFVISVSSLDPNECGSTPPNESSYNFCWITVDTTLNPGTYNTDIQLVRYPTGHTPIFLNCNGAHVNKIQIDGAFNDNVVYNCEVDDVFIADTNGTNLYDNEIGTLYLQSASENLFHENTIQTVSISYLPHGAFNNPSINNVFTNNNFYGVFGNGVIWNQSAQHNWWGTHNETEIQNKISGYERVDYSNYHCFAYPSNEMPPCSNDVDNDAYKDAAFGGNDCNDNDSAIHPNAPELCDGLDNNCDGSMETDEVDGDGDGHMICEGDCNDNQSSISPGAIELCDNLDNNCDGQVDEGDVCVNICSLENCKCSREGLGYCAEAWMANIVNDSVLLQCSNWWMNGTPETCNEIDDDCDGEMDEGDVCEGVCSLEQCRCSQEGVDTCAILFRANPVDNMLMFMRCINWFNAGTNETCNGIDDNCNGEVDENCEAKSISVMSNTMMILLAISITGLGLYGYRKSK